jgi:hypothetical protein
MKLTAKQIETAVEEALENGFQVTEDIDKNLTLTKDTTKVHLREGEEPRFYIDDTELSREQIEKFLTDFAAAASELAEKINLTLDSISPLFEAFNNAAIQLEQNISTTTPPDMTGTTVEQGFNNIKQIMMVYVAKAEDADYDIETGEFTPKHYKPMKLIDVFGKDNPIDFEGESDDD